MSFGRFVQADGVGVALAATAGPVQHDCHVCHGSCHPASRIGVGSDPSRQKSMSCLAPTSAPTMSSAIEKTTAADGLRLLNTHSSIVIVMGAKLRRTEIMGTDSVRIAWRQRVAVWGHSAGAPTAAGQQRATRQMNQ
jgi:hypothetical protein